jgi:hypothetical protein
VQLDAHAMDAATALVATHLERGPDARGEAIDVERIDQECAVDLLGRAREATQYQHTTFVELAADEFLRDEVHSVLQRRHETEIRRSIDGGQQVRVDVVVNQHDRRPVDGSVARIDVEHHRRDFLLQRRIGRHRAARGRADAKKRYALSERRVCRPQLVDSAKSLRYPLRVVDAVHGDAELSAAARVALAQRRDARLRRRTARHVLEPLDIDADRKRPDMNCPSIPCDLPLGAVDARVSDELLDAIEKIGGVAHGLEFDQIIPQQASEQELMGPRRQKPQDVRWRKRDVPELMDERRRPHRAHELGDEREVVIMDPHDRAPVASLGFVGNGVGEAQVDRPIAFPERRPKLEVLDEHVAQRPQRAVGEPMVVALDVRIIEPDAAQRVGLLIGRHANASRPIRRLVIR